MLNSGKRTTETSETQSLHAGVSKPTEVQDQSLSTSTEPTRDSSRRWQKPKDFRGLARQVNQIATEVLNGEIDLEQARTYSSLTRVIAQLATNETTKARFGGQQADFDLDDEIG